MGAQSLLIDTDPGIDDAAAIAVAVASPELRLSLLSTVAGNVSAHRGATNALALLRLLESEQTPVVVGARTGLVREKPWHRAVHGDDGLGGRAPTSGTGEVDPRSAVRAIADILAAQPLRSVTLVAIAPLTNVALLLGGEPEIARRVSRIVVMGGSSQRGNVTPYAEYNTWADPEAAARVLNAEEIGVCLVPLEVTRAASLGQSGLAALQDGPRSSALLASMIEAYDEPGPPSQRPLHDLVALAAVLEPDLLTWRRATVEVDTSDDATRGRTRIRSVGRDRPGASMHGHANPTITVATGLDLPRWRELVIARLTAS